MRAYPTGPIHLSIKGKSMITGRIEPTAEDLAIVKRNLDRLQRWCRESGQSDHGRVAMKACRGFVTDMAEFPKDPIQHD